MDMAVDAPAANGHSGGATAAGKGRAQQLAESLKLEHQFLRAPLEHLKKTLRLNHRAVEKEISAVLYNVTELSSSSGEDNRPKSREEVVQQLTCLVSRLHGLKRKLEEGARIENLQVQRCKARLEHLDSLTPDGQAEWNSIRLKRILVDYMLRMSYYETAEKLANVSGLQSTIELQLRLQEFIEMVRVDNTMQAISYARKHLSLWAASHMKELQRVMATLAFKSSTECATYKVLFEPKQWDSLVELFKQEFFRLYGMTLEPLLNIYLQAGLTALKTPLCYEESCTKEDPLSQESFRSLATSLPFSKQQNSKLVCYISKELMDTENPPLVLPNGYVYSTKALEAMAKKNDGKIICPRTGYSCNFGELVKAFIS
ncbi:lisH/CRA/RING-U-box domains-containing protein isoform X2 [Wolffia australiana]